MTLAGVTISASMAALACKAALTAARHMPAPRATSFVLYRWVFDTIQDLANNNDRIGEVRPQSIPNEEIQNT